MPSFFATPNFDKWASFCEPLPTHDRFVQFGYLWMVSAALERRVWMDSAFSPTYPNMYMLFVGPPGCGKSQVSDKIKGLFHSIMATDGLDNNSNLRVVRASTSRNLFKLSADSTSFEAFVTFTAGSSKTVKDAISKGMPYVHCSPQFILDEASSIFNQHAEDMATFLLSGWTCTPIYNRTTQLRGTESIKNLCVNLIGGTQPKKLAKLVKSTVIEDGFSRRRIMVYAEKARRNVVFIDESPDNVAQYKHIQSHIQKLGGSNIFGQLKLTPAARAWMIDTYDTHKDKQRINTASVLAEYQNTKIQHIKKLAMAIHFGESLEMTLDVGVFQHAKMLLDAIEIDMHKCYEGERDVRQELINKLRALVRESGVNGLEVGELYVDVYDICDLEDLHKTLQDLVAARQLVMEGSKYKLSESVT